MPVKSLSTLQTEQPKMGESSKMAEERAQQVQQGSSNSEVKKSGVV